MATSTITALTAGTALGGTEVAPFDQGGATVKITAEQLRTFCLAAESANPPGRLTLTTGVPITTTDVTGATTIYYTAFRGGTDIMLWSGSAWTSYSMGSEISLALGTLVSGKNYDVFVYQNAGTPTLEFLVWTSDTARATAVTLQDGRYCKSGDKTRLYLGTFRTTSTTTTEDSGGGITTQVGGKRFLWNHYNRVRRQFAVFDSTAQYNYTTATWRQQSAAAGNKVEYVQGVSEDPVDFTASDGITNQAAGATSSLISVGVDSTTTPSKSIGGIWGNGTQINMCFARYEGFPGVGYHALNCIQSGNGATGSYFGVYGGFQPVSQGGIQG